jgi:rSAM/selenodomain-associated transferase 1
MRKLPLLVVMVKAPVCGAVKTRLGKDIGPVQAAALYRTLTSNLLREVSSDPRFETLLAIAPDHAIGARFAAWNAAPGAMRFKQGPGGLDRRMQGIFDRYPKHPVIIVGSDIPFITRGTIANAFKGLAGADAVFGPAKDGGYWLVGLRQLPRRLTPFENVRWSTENALKDTLRNLVPHRVALAKTLFDVDTAIDYRRYLRKRYR